MCGILARVYDLFLLVHKVRRESVHLVEAAKALVEASKFVNVELDLSRTLAERALTSFSAGDLHNAMRTARGARHGHRTAWKFLPALIVTAKQRELIEEKLAELEGMMAKLSGLCGSIPRPALASEEAIALRNALKCFMNLFSNTKHSG